MLDVCESPELFVGGIHHDVGEAVAEPVPGEFWGISDRALRRLPAKLRWAEEVAVALLHREPSGNAPGAASPACLEIRFALGRLHPSTKRLKNPLIHRYPEATSSAYRATSSHIWTLVPIHPRFNPTVLQNPCIPRPPSVLTTFHCKLNATSIDSYFCFQFCTCLHQRGGRNLEHVQAFLNV